MNLLPYERFTIQSNLSHGEVLKRLGDSIEPLKLFGWGLSFDHKPYQGTLSQEKFSAKRIIHFSQDTFLPQIAGRIRDEMDQTIVDIEMYLPGFAIAFSTIGLFISISAGIILVTNGTISSVQDLAKAPGLYTALLAFFLNPIGLLIYFRFEYTNSSEFFRTLLEDTTGR